MSRKSTNLNRRQFLGLGATAAAFAGMAGLAGCAPQSPAEPAAEQAAPADGGETMAATGADSWLGEEPSITDADVTETIEADVVVVGLGTAGVAAARAAAEEGATVIAFEKGATVGSRSGQFAVFNGAYNKRWGQETFDVDFIADHEMDECSYFPKRAIWTRWAKEGADVFQWYAEGKSDLIISDTSVTEAAAPGEEGASSQVTLSPQWWPQPPHYDWHEETHPCLPASVIFTPGHQPVLEANLTVAQDTGNVDARFGCFVEKLIMEDGACTGVYVRDAESGTYLRANATKGVIMACGEYASNPDMVAHFCPDVAANGTPVMWPNMDVEGNPTNTGDGLKMGAWAGAAIQQHHAPMIHHMGGPGGSGMEGSMGVMGINPWLRLDKHGRRFMNEDCPGQQTENQIENLKDMTCYMIWDGNWADQLQWFPASHGIQLSVTPEALAAQVEAGRVLEADSVEALLDAIGDIDKTTALASIDRYNQLAKAGKDEDFGKKAERMFPVETGPFYAATMAAAPMLVCIGGLVSDEEARVYDTEGAVIEKLYAAGNIQGSRFAVQYPIALEGVSHSLALFYGYVAGKNAVAGK